MTPVHDPAILDATIALLRAHPVEAALAIRRAHIALGWAGAVDGLGLPTNGRQRRALDGSLAADICGSESEWTLLVPDVGEEGKFATEGEAQAAADAALVADGWVLLEVLPPQKPAEEAP